MPDFLYDPPVPPTIQQGFIQRIDLRERGKVIASARWHAAMGADGVAQVLDLTVISEQRRRGNGSTVLTAIIRQAVECGNARAVPMRRIWIAVEQKTQINARAFLTRNGFHHVSTVKELLSHQDALIYMRSLD